MGLSRLQLLSNAAKLRLFCFRRRQPRLLFPLKQSRQHGQWPQPAKRLSFVLKKVDQDDVFPIAISAVVLVLVACGALGFYALQKRNEPESSSCG